MIPHFGRLAGWGWVWHGCLASQEEVFVLFNCGGLPVCVLSDRNILPLSCCLPPPPPLPPHWTLIPYVHEVTVHRVARQNYKMQVHVCVTKWSYCFCSLVVLLIMLFDLWYYVFDECWFSNLIGFLLMLHDYCFAVCFCAPLCFVLALYSFTKYSHINVHLTTTYCHCSCVLYSAHWPTCTVISSQCYIMCIQQHFCCVKFTLIVTSS